MKSFLISLIILTCLVSLVFSIIDSSSARQSINIQADVLANLDYNDVKYVSLIPYNKTNSLINDSVVITDRSEVNNIVTAYKELQPQKPGDGRLDGIWQLEIDLVCNGSIIKSYIYHNEYSDLVFIVSPNRPAFSSLDDFFSSRKLSTIILNSKALNKKS